MSTKAWKRSGSAIRSPSPQFFEKATLFPDGDSFFEAVRDSDTDNPKNAVVMVEDGRLPASIIDFGYESGYAFHYIQSDGSEVGLKKTPPKKEFEIGVLLDE